MHIIAHGFHRLYGYIVGQQAVQLITQLLAIDSALEVEVGHHHTGMNTGIGTSGTSNLDVGTQQQRQGSLQLLLHRDAVGLYLPAVKTGSVVA